MFSSLKILLAGIVDYAGLFPPAKLSIREAIANYAQYYQSPHNWMLGNFVVPVARLAELEKLVSDVSLVPWSLSVILSKNWEVELEQIQKINNLDKIKVAALEFQMLPPEEIQQAINHLPTEIESFFEIPLSENLETYLSVLQGTKASAKIRTGGLTTQAFPNVEKLCRFILTSAEAQVPFKATAGLHHPIRGKYPISYETNSASATMHGFLNLSIVSALVYGQKITESEALQVLQELSITSFQVQEDTITWNNFHLNIDEIQTARKLFFRSFGSCSFQEPIDEIRELQL